ncbi:MAG TPA: hypothetical protein VGG33_12440 [Polyangia bacterium]
MKSWPRARDARVSLTRPAWWLLAAGLGFVVSAGCDAPGGPLLLDDPCWQGAPSGGAPLDLQCTGLYDNWQEKRLSPKARPFAPGTILWSDGAIKRRFLSLPDNTTIDTSNPNEWVFPVGTKAWKEFALGTRVVETRLFEKVAANKWLRAAYVWSADGKTATRYDRGIPNFEGTGYSVPSVSDCDKCHEGRVDRLLGFEAISLAEPTATGLTLDVLNAEGRLAPAVDPAQMRIPPTVDPATRAAVSWLHVNCGISCHNRAADSTAMATQMFLRLEHDQLAGAAVAGPAAFDALQTTVGVRARISKWSGSLRIKPGSPIDSLLFRLATSRGPEQMPPILTHKPDPDGTRVLREWIGSMTPTAALP